MGIQIAVKLSSKERDYVDHLIEQGIFSSYAHALRALLYWYKQNQKTILGLRAQNAGLRERIKLLEEGYVLQEKKKAALGT